MRIRYKKWARPELEASEFYIDNPEELYSNRFSRCNVGISKKKCRASIFRKKYETRKRKAYKI